MKRSNLRLLLTASVILLPSFAFTQDSLRGTLTMGLGDVAAPHKPS